MGSFRSVLHATLGLALLAPLGTLGSRAVAAAELSGRRSTLAITYGEGSSTSVDMMAVASRQGELGRADVKRKDGRTRVSVHLEPLPHPQSYGSLYTTYVLWAIAPEGQAASLAELPASRRIDTEVTTPFQTFGLIVTAEPHSAVSLPSPLLVAENFARKDTVGGFQTSTIEYGGAMGPLYQSSGPRDYQTPLLVLGARRAVELARDGGAVDYAGKELQQAELELRTLEAAWPRSRSLPKNLEGMARDVMRLAEHARTVAEERHEQDRLAAERRDASNRVARAQSQADRAREDAQAAHERAQREQERAAREAARAELEKDRASAAQSDAERAKSEKELALAMADSARQDADAARRDKLELQQQLYESLSKILETRREARGLIVNLSDVLFDFDRASLTPGAREKLAKLAGVMIAYPGNYRLDIEGHTDAIGSDEYNQRLSTDRAESVHGYLSQSGISAGRFGNVQGFGETRPVASNDSESGRQMNRRVEIVIGDLDR